MCHDVCIHLVDSEYTPACTVNVFNIDHNGLKLSLGLKKNIVCLG